MIVGLPFSQARVSFEDDEGKLSGDCRSFAPEGFASCFPKGITGKKIG